MTSPRQTFAAVPAWWPMTAAYHQLGAATRVLAFELWVSLPPGVERLPNDERHVQMLLGSRDDPRRIRRRLDALIEAGLIALRGHQLVLVGRATHRVKVQRKARTKSNVSPMRPNVSDSQTISTACPDPYVPVVRAPPTGGSLYHPLTVGPDGPLDAERQGPDPVTLAKPPQWWRIGG